MRLLYGLLAVVVLAGLISNVWTKNWTAVGWILSATVWMGYAYWLERDVESLQRQISILSKWIKESMPSEPVTPTGLNKEEPK